MSDKIKISELPEATEMALSDIFAIVQGGVTKKAPASLLPGQDLGYTAENIANKTPSWTGTPNHNRYPTEKLVKDTIDGQLSYILGKIPHPFNFIAFDDLGNYAYMNSAFAAIKKGDIFVAEDLTGNPAELTDGDWIIAMDNMESPFSEANYNNPAKWLKVKFQLTASQIRDLLQTLIGTNRLSKAAIQGADFALNRRGKGDVTDTPGFQNVMGNRHKGDYWIFDDGVGGGGGGGGGESETLENGDWIICLVNNATLHSTDSGYLDSEQWDIIKISKLDSLNAVTAEQIRDLLHTLQGEHMLSSDNILWDGETSLKVYLATIIQLDINSRQKRLFTERYIISGSGESSMFTITGKKIHPVLLHVNRVPYSGKEGEPETVGAFDYTYKHEGNNTVITSNTSFDPPLTFNGNDIVDILHSVTPSVSIDEPLPDDPPIGVE